MIVFKLLQCGPDPQLPPAMQLNRTGHFILLLGKQVGLI